MPEAPEHRISVHLDELLQAKGQAIPLPHPRPAMLDEHGAGGARVAVRPSRSDAGRRPCGARDGIAQWPGRGGQSSASSKGTKKCLVRRITITVPAMTPQGEPH